MLRRLLYRAHHIGMRMAGDHRPPGTDVVNVAAAIGVVQIRAFAAREEDRCAADALEGAHRRVHAAGDALLRGAEELFGSGHGVVSNKWAMARAAASGAGSANTA